MVLNVFIPFPKNEERVLSYFGRLMVLVVTALEDAIMVGALG